MHLFARLYQYINILSIDVVAGAVIGALFFGSVLGTQVSFEALTSLAITVWIVYTLDHLRDALFITDVASTDRHRYHQEHFKTVAFLVVIIGLIDLLVILLLPPELLGLGAAVGVAVMLYLILQRYLKFMKEFFVACLYTIGILLPALSTRPEFHSIHFILIGKYFITAFMNLLLFSLIDYNEDRRQQQHSFVTWFGPASTRRGILLLGLVNIVSGFWLWEFDWRVALIFIAMNVLLLAILFLQKHLLVHNYYRIAGDAVFFIPLLYLL